MLRDFLGPEIKTQRGGGRFRAKNKKGGGPYATLAADRPTTVAVRQPPVAEIASPPAIGTDAWKALSEAARHADLKSLLHTCTINGMKNGGVSQMLRMYLTKIAPLERQPAKRGFGWRGALYAGKEYSQAWSDLLGKFYEPILARVVEYMEVNACSSIWEAANAIEKERIEAGDFRNFMKRSSMSCFRKAEVRARFKAKLLDPDLASTALEAPPAYPMDDRGESIEEEENGESSEVECEMTDSEDEEDMVVDAAEVAADEPLPEGTLPLAYPVVEISMHTGQTVTDGVPATQEMDVGEVPPREIEIGEVLATRAAETQTEWPERSDASEVRAFTQGFDGLSDRVRHIIEDVFAAELEGLQCAASALKTRAEAEEALVRAKAIAEKTELMPLPIRIAWEKMCAAERNRRSVEVVLLLEETCALQRAWYRLSQLIDNLLCNRSTRCNARCDVLVHAR